MQQGSSALVGQETIPGHIGSNTICCLSTAPEPGPGLSLEATQVSPCSGHCHGMWREQFYPTQPPVGPARVSPLGRVPFPSHVMLLSCPRQEVSTAGDACLSSSPAGEAFALPKCLPCQHVPGQPQDSHRLPGARARSSTQHPG